MALEIHLKAGICILKRHSPYLCWEAAAAEASRAGCQDCGRVSTSRTGRSREGRGGCLRLGPSPRESGLAHAGLTRALRSSL